MLYLPNRSRLILVGKGVPSLVPEFVGQRYINKSTGDIYIAAETFDAKNWGFVGTGDITNIIMSDTVNRTNGAVDNNWTNSTVTWTSSGGGYAGWEIYNGQFRIESYAYQNKSSILEGWLYRSYETNPVVLPYKVVFDLIVSTYNKSGVTSTLFVGVGNSQKAKGTGVLLTPLLTSGIYNWEVKFYVNGSALSTQYINISSSDLISNVRNRFTLVATTTTLSLSLDLVSDSISYTLGSITYPGVYTNFGHNATTGSGGQVDHYLDNIEIWGLPL